MAEAIPTGRFGNPLPDPNLIPARPRAKKTTTNVPNDKPAARTELAYTTPPHIAAEHCRVLEEALDDWHWDETASTVQRANLRLIQDTTQENAA
ncbi:hypothetical protein [Streptomyces sp. NPDC060243]|uniref:hypothetical protein n=1 Tax=Streptomyces sp. NPDC060243 TaxID=3347081 RepID=UPI0036485EC9